MPGDADLAASYDQLPYEDLAFAEVHPDRLATAATLFGLDPPPVGSARVLEIGCAGGGNLIPIALGLPEARCVGVDLSHRQIAGARSFARQVGASNVDLKAMDLTGIDADFGTFDYILCHGVYSWVPEPIRRRILEICRANLAPGGLALVSYNVLPGWHARLAVRELMLYFSASEADPRRRLARARSTLDGLARSLSGSEAPYARRLRAEADQVRASSDPYIAHEFLEVDNEPVYYRQFVDRAASAGLRVVADARPRTMAANQAEDVRRAVASAAGEGVLAREQYLDFLVDRTFRRTILCREEAEPFEVASADRVDRLRALAIATPEAPPADPRAPIVESFRSVVGNDRLSTSDPLSRAILRALAESMPRSLPFDELVGSVRSRLGPAFPASVEAGRSAVSKALLDGHNTGFVELRAHEPPLAHSAGDRPLASPLARFQIASGRSTVTNLRNRAIRPSDFDRLVLRQLDGHRDRGKIVAALVAAVRAGEFVVQLGDLPITDPPTLRDVLGRSLEPSLARSAAGALLMA